MLLFQWEGLLWGHLKTRCPQKDTNTNTETNYLAWHNFLVNVGLMRLLWWKNGRFDLKAHFQAVMDFLLNLLIDYVAPNSLLLTLPIMWVYWHL